MRKFSSLFALAMTTLLVSSMCTGQAETVKTRAVNDGATAKLFGIRPRQLDLGAQKPDGIKEMPDGIGKPLYGMLTLGPAETIGRFAVVMDATAQTEPRFWIDANGNGDLTDDPPIVWKKSLYASFDGTMYALYQGSVALQVHYGSQTVSLRLSLTRYDPRDPSRDLLQNTLLYTADYAREAELLLGSRSYHGILYDLTASGDFRGKQDTPNSGVALYLDVNGNGQFDARGEFYNASRPFNIKGVTYELANMQPDGSAFDIVKSKTSVSEIPPPPDLRVGQSVLPFTHKLLDGKTVRFPADYKGKLVLLYFWASYCPDCQAEIPIVRNAYKQFHERGLDILGVSVDPAELPIPLAKYVEASHMPWPQVYEGKLMDGDIARLYFIQNIPSPFLVDGNTGKIIATGDDLKGARLAETLQKALTHKKE